MAEEKLDRFLDRAERLLGRIEALLGAPERGADWERAVAWRWDGGFHAVRHPQPMRLDDLLHIERQREEMERNTRQFLRGLPANNALLWGSRGTGKSSLVKALLSAYAGQGLRLVEVERHHLVQLPRLVDHLYWRPERFVVFSDDLSFSADDPGYKALKAVLDGSVAAAPENVLIYATSNRRHLMPETMAENREAQVEEGELHLGDALEEKISLSERFGLWLSFHPFSQDQYLQVVAHWLERLGGPDLDTGDTRLQALRWATRRGSRSGRVAAQFARDWSGRQGLLCGRNAPDR